METIVYRKVCQPGMQPNESDHTGKNHARMTSLASPTPPPLQYEIFYPLLSEAEQEVWSHWLPTTLVFDRTRLTCHADIVDALTKHHAPPEVMEEFQWSWNMELFDTYELKTPMRQDSRDPLLIGRQGQSRYGVALWGESLRPFHDIAQLVQQSLQVRRRATLYRTWLPVGGTLAGFLLGILLAGQGTFEGSNLNIGAAFAAQGFIFTWLPFWMYSPENRQHNYLDRYRS